MSLFIAELGDRAFLHIHGAETEKFLQGLITQDISDTTKNKALYSCLLTPQGKIITDFFLYKQDDGFLLDCHKSVLETLTKKLILYKMRAKVTIEPISTEQGVWALWQADSDQAPTMPDMVGGAYAYPDPRLKLIGVRIISQKSSSPSIDNAALASQADYETHLTELGVPVFSRDILPEQIFPLDANLDLLQAVNYRKGCFVGQEVTSRMKRKGEVRKRIWRVLSDEAVLTRGTVLKAGNTTIGEVTSGSGTQGLAMVRLDRLAGASHQVTSESGSPVTLVEPPYLKEKQ